jgi:ferrochelatase
VPEPLKELVAISIKLSRVSEDLLDDNFKMKKKGVLLLNLGSPNSTSVADVRKYLREFLMDGRVLDAPFPIRWFVVHALILPTRPKESAEAYGEVWLPEGSPLIVTSQHQADALEKQLEDIPVELAMRYQNPSIENAVDKLLAEGVEQLVILPLFPHYAMSSYESALVKAQNVLAKKAPQVELEIVPPFYDDDEFVDAMVASSAGYLSEGYDHILFSFHGLPERHLRKSDPTGEHCLSCENCCEGTHPAHKTCYRSQCYKTVEAFVEKVGVPAEKHSVSFQSRLGRDPWLKPYTDFTVKELAGKGVKKLLVVCPAFVADCLETIEEIGMRAKEDFVEAGGEDLTLVPCVNEHPRWLEGMETLTRRHLERLPA